MFFKLLWKHCPETSFQKHLFVQQDSLWSARAQRKNRFMLLNVIVLFHVCYILWIAFLKDKSAKEMVVVENPSAALLIAARFQHDFTHVVVVG